MTERHLTQRSSIRAAEFFAGIGLVRLALEQAGIETVFANDIDPAKLEMYAANFTTDCFRLGDIHAISADEVPACELFTASFPCNDLSIAGAMAGINGAHSGAFWGLVRLLREKSRTKDLPRFVMLENVPGFLMSNDGKDFLEALLAIGLLGYALDAVVVDAARFAPQSRPRLFVIAQLDVTPRSTFGVAPSEIRPARLWQFIQRHPEVPWRLKSHPALPQSAPKLPSIIEDLPPTASQWWNEERTQYFMNQLSDRHAAQAAMMIDGARYSYATAFRRVRKGRSMAELRTDGIAGCLRTPRGGSGRQILFKGGRGKRAVRLLTARECARLQGTPDSYRIDVPLNQALFGFGDAVCVPVVEWIAKRYFADTESSSNRVLTAAKRGGGG